MAEEQVIDDYYVSLQKGEIDSRARIGDLSKEELLDKLKENLNADLDQIAAQINSSGKDKWRNSTVKSTAQQNKHIRFSSPSDDDEENKENKEERLEKKQSPRKSNEKSPSPSKRNGGKKPFNNRKQSPSKPKKVIDYNQFEALNGAPRVNEIIAFQILEISSNFTPEVSDYKVGTVIEFDSKTNETTLQLHSEYNSILKRSNKFSIVFEETEDDEQLTYEDSPRSNKSNKEEEIIKVDWRNLMNIKLIPEGFDLKQLQEEDELEEESEQKATNGHKSEDESEEQVIDDYYETVKKVDRYNKSNTNKKTNCCGKQQQQQQKQETKPDQKSVVKKQQEEKAKNDDLNRIASSVNAHAKAKWKNSAPSKAANSNAPKHIRFPSGSSSSSSCSSSSSSSSDSSSSNDDEEMRSVNENKSKAKTNKNNQDRKEKVVQNKKSEQTVNKVKQLLTTASPEISKPNSSQVTKTKSPKTQSLKSIDSKNKTKEEEKEKEKPTVAIDTQTFMIQIGNVFELNSNSKEVTVKFNSNYKSEINLKITNKDQSDDVSEKKKKKKKEEKSVELDWKNSMNVKLIPNEISLNMKSQKEGEEEKEEDDDVKMKESDSSSNESESESESESEEDEKEIVASKKSSNQKTANQKRKINEPARHQKQTSQKVNEEKANSKTTKTDSSSSSKKATHIRFDSSSSDSSNSSSSCSSASSDSSTSSDSEDEPIERKPQPNLKSKQYTNQQQYNKPVAKKNQQQEAAKTSPQKQANNTQQQEQRNKYYQPSKEDQVNAISYNRAFLLQNPKDMSDFKKVFNQTKLNAPNPEEFLLKYDQDDQHPPELIIDEEEVLAQQQHQLIESATSQYQEPSSYQDQDQQTTDDQLQFLQEQQNAFVAPPKIDFTKFEPLSGVPNAEDKIAFQLLEISPNYTPEVSSYKVATVLGFDHNSGEITLKLDDNVLDKPSTSLVEGLDLLANGEFRPQEPKDDVLRMDWRNLMNIRLLPKAHL